MPMSGTETPALDSVSAMQISGTKRSYTSQYSTSAPRLISDAQIQSMRDGSVIYDLAAEAGGNVEGTEAGQTVTRHGVRIIGPVQPARALAADAGALFSRNIYNFLAAFWDADPARFVFPDDDEIVSYLDDDAATISNPNLPTDQTAFQPPRWLPASGQFANGATSIQQLFAHMVADYGTIPANSVAIDAANAETAPATDILDTPRNSPDLGAYERP